MKMLLDIGNSMTKICLNKGISIKNIKKIENKKIKDYEKNLKNILVNFKKNKIEKIFISSVNLKILNITKKTITKIFPQLDVKILKNYDFKNFKIKYKEIHKFGSDRFFNCIGAKYILNNKNLIIIDIGTATTVDVVSSDFEYLGGQIFSGPLTSYSTLISNTSMIGNHDLLISKKILGKSTAQCLSSGFIYSNSIMFEGLVKKIQKEYNKKFQTLITGGLSNIFSKFLPKDFIIDKELTLKGIMFYINEINRSKI